MSQSFRQVLFNEESLSRKNSQEQFKSQNNTANRYKQYKTLYRFDPQVELAEYELPLGRVPSGMLNTLQLPPLHSDKDKSGKKRIHQNREVRETLFIEPGSAIHEELMRIKTGEDAISFFAKNGSTTPIKFILCNKAEQSSTRFRPYDLIVVKEDKVNPEYYTISAQGVVYVCKQSRHQLTIEEQRGAQTEFYSLSDWMHQSTMFNLLTSMKFFKHYLPLKIFTQWRNNVRYQHYLMTRKNLIKHLFHAKPAFAPTLCKINGYLYDLSTKKTIILNDKQSHMIDDFETQCKNQREEVKKEYENNFFASILQDMESMIAAVHDATNIKDMEELQQVKVGKQAKLKSMTQAKEEAKMRRRTLYLANQNKRSLGAFIRVIDYMTTETTVQLNLSSLAKFVEDLKSTERKLRPFVCNVEYGTSAMIFNPHENAFKESFENILKSMWKECNWSRILWQPQWDNERSEEGLTDTWKPDELIYKSRLFKKFSIEINKKIEGDYKEAYQYVAETFEKCRDVNEFCETFDIEKYEGEDRSTDEIKELMDKLKLWETSIFRDIPQAPQSHWKFMLSIDGKRVRSTLSTKVTGYLKRLEEYLTKEAKDKAEATFEEFKAINEQLAKKPVTLNEFVQHKEMVEEFKKKAVALVEAKTKVEEMYNILKRKVQNLKPEHNQTQEYLNEEYKKYQDELEENQDWIRNRIQEMRNKVQNGNSKLKEEIQEIGQKLDEGSIINEESTPEQALEELKEIEKDLKNKVKKAEKYKHFQEVLEDKVDKQKELEHLVQKFETKNKLWTCYNNWNNQYVHWFKDDFNSVDFEQMKIDVMKFNKDGTVLKSTLKKDAVAEKFYGLVQGVSSNLTLIEDLGNPALQQRHWKQIFETMQTSIVWAPGKTFSLEDIYFDALKVKNEISDISATASGEYSLENQLKEIKQKWATQEFTVKNYQEKKDRFVLGSIEEVLQLLEENQNLLQNMLANRYVHAIKDQVEEWDKKLRLVGDVIDEWLSCQRQWMYLESIFAAEDIQKVLAAESAKFETINKFFKDTMMKTNKNKNVVESCTKEGLLDKFIVANKHLDIIQKSLDDFLEEKRSKFPRFYFLSDDELIEILSQTRNPKAVQPHLRKCFDNIAEAQFKEDEDLLDASAAQEIVGMFSAEKEYVDFKESVMTEGMVEYWLKAFENMMRETLYTITKEALQKYPANGLERNEWFFLFTAQPIIIVDQIMWTKTTQEAIQLLSQGQKNALKEQFLFCKKQISKEVEIVRGPLKPLQRSLIGVLIVLDVHSRDVVDQLIKQKVESTFDFEWSKILKYYWDTDVDDCVVRQTNAKFMYGYEYLGNNPRLVITPLTDKCYMTLTGALHMNYGGAPEGPAGTGKTESTKDLAKALAVQCVVFNCSDGLDVKMMGQFFSGLAQAGAWACFDEFNRIDIEVLSVIAQQILTIQSAVRDKKEQFDFQGKVIPLNPRFGVFITMNPGYAGRTELPDNLKALFRPVAMMIPDYAMIAEIMLFSEGFETAFNLARKMVQLYKLASEQLSKQDHYDFGMRAVKSVLVMAGNLKRQNPNLNEDVVLIRAMRDSNVPKFLDHDLPLFKGIIQDLFPNVEVPFVDYGDLEKQIRKELEIQGKQQPDRFIEKIIQLLETMIVRHGNMVVGEAGCGKSTIINILASSLTSLQKAGSTNDWYKEIKQFWLNPKAITMGELYGELSKATNEWKDGLIAFLVRQAVKDTSDTKKWIIFDGPVDALWIENMNTVLDDNKTLCLANAERIKLPQTVTMVFEVKDLAVASPATVSRCGMVYVEAAHLGWLPLVQSWSIEFTQQLGEEYKEQAAYIVDNLKNLIQPVLQFLRQNCKEIIQSTDSNLVKSCLNICRSLFDKEEMSKYHQEYLRQIIQGQFVFAFIWSFGANIHDKFRKIFSDFIKKQLQSVYRFMPFENDLYDYRIELESGGFDLWQNKVPEYRYDPKVSFFNILVPTIDTLRLNYILGILLKRNCNVLFSGETGVGKSVITHDFLKSIAGGEEFVSCYMNFSAKTNSTNLKNLYETKLDKKTSKILGPPPGKKMIIFIDDINMPQLDRYGSQPPVELFRQTIDQGGFYDLVKYLFKKVTNTLFVSACAPPGGGRNPVTPRLFRHFNMIWMPELQQATMVWIFKQMLQGFLANHDTNPDIQEISEQIVNSTIEIYLKITTEKLPTPAKCHYTFNLRDLSKVFQGVLSTSYDLLPDENSVKLLWLHEASRVFRDRLIDEIDRSWFNDKLQINMNVTFPISMDKEEWVNVIFGYFESPSEYRRVKSMEELNTKLNEYLEMYNADQTTPMDLVFFNDAIAHLSRVCRILKQPRGNALLVGVGGSGRQSLTKLSTFICQFKIFQIEVTKNYGVNAFHDDLKLLMAEAGAKDQSSVFLISDSQIADESFLEDINNILNTGEVPNLFTWDEREEIIGQVRPLAKDAGIVDQKDLINQYFVYLCRENLHIVLAFSPVGDQFRNRVRQFPSIINCCTIDWYNAWPNDALFSVATKAFEREITLGIPDYKEQLAKICVEIHSSSTKFSDKFFEELRRRNYTTPTSYLELIKLYIQLLGIQQAIVPQKINRYKIGLKRLAETNEQVEVLQQELIKLQPQIEKAKIDTENKMVIVQAKQSEASVEEAAVAEETTKCEEQMKEIQLISDDCKRDLDEALPDLYKALKALDKLKPEHIIEVKSFSSPNEKIKMVMEAVLLLFKKPQTWDEARKLLNEPQKFISNCKEYDKDNIPPALLRKLEKYTKNPEFTPANIEKVSVACTSLCAWVTAMEKYAYVVKRIEPKKKAQAEAEEKLHQAQKLLSEKEAALKKVKDQVAKLQAEFEATLKQKEDLIKQQEQTNARLVRADKLVSGLQSEQKRWIDKVKELGDDMYNLMGNIIVAAGCVSYLGPFTLEYRKQLMQNWIQYCSVVSIPVGADFSLERVLADPVKVREWQLCGLPADQLSTDNAVIVTMGRRWSLIIDPQGQANKWIKNMGKENSKSTKLTDSQFMQVLESGIRFGQSILLENVEEYLDPSLEPVLLRKIYKKGQMMMRLGDKEIPYNQDFRFFITTKLANPHYLPEICIKVTIINFTVTIKGLEDQLLAEVVKYEMPELEEQKDKLIVELSNDQDQLVELEKKVLQLISDAEGYLLDQEDLIQTLSRSKSTSEVINERMVKAEETKIRILAAREQYRIVAKRGSVLYFVIADMANVDPMYQYSLDFFIKLFQLRLDKSQKSESVQERLDILIQDITLSFYRNICRGLFEKDKLLYAFMNAIKIQIQAGMIPDQEWNFFVRGSLTDFSGRRYEDNTGTLELSDTVWHKILALGESSSVFKEIPTSFRIKPKDWKAILQSEEPNTIPFPQPFNQILNPFQKLLVIKCIREEKLIFAIRDYVESALGRDFIESPPFDLEGAFQDSTPATPIIFVLSPGADPITYLVDLAKEQEMLDKMRMLSLGQGQGEIAAKYIDLGRRNGEWIVLQNCHLAASWMPKLEEIQEQQVESDLMPAYRLWLTSMPSPVFPVPVLQSGIKLTNEPPKGLKANLGRSFNEINEKIYEGCQKPYEYHRLLFSLAFFHGVILERRKFGAIGWNIPYEWMNSDFAISRQQLKMFLDEQPDVPYKSINVIISEINYGGRVTDDKDKRCIESILYTYVNPSVLNKNYSYESSGLYHPPEQDDLASVREYIAGLPIEESPEVYGLHPNANITYQKKQVKMVLDSILSLQPRQGSGGSGKTQDEIVFQLCDDFKQRLPQRMDKNKANENTFALQGESINSLGVFISQEIERFNKLLMKMARTLDDLQKAIKGTVVMSLDLEKMFNNFINNQVPIIWSDIAYPSLKPLSSWYNDMLERVQFINSWLVNGPPVTYWLSALFFPQGFMTATLQTYARRTKIAIDTLKFKFHVMSYNSTSCKAAPQNGVNMHGLFIQGCSWNWDGWLEESKPKTLFELMPVIWIEPVDVSQEIKDQSYQAPLYKTSTRHGTLSTTGHSTNFVLFVDLKSKVDPKHWINRGVALLCQLDD